MSETLKRLFTGTGVDPLVPMSKGELVVVPSPERKLVELTASIQRDHEEAEAAAQTAVLMGIATGKGLAELKRLVPHGQFERYVAINFTFTMGTAQKYMRLARREPQLLQTIERLRSIGLHLSMREALKHLDTLRAEDKPKPIKRKPA
jgi:Protein of unknown function (DUF3102)